MKKSLNIFLAMLTAVSMALSMFSTTLATAPYLHAGLNTWETWLDNPEDDPDTLVWEGTVHNPDPTGPAFGAKYVCPGGGCPPVGYYASMTIRFNYSTHHPAEPYIIISLPNTDPLIYERVDCEPMIVGEPDWIDYGSCEATLDNGHVLAEDMYWNLENPWTYTITAALEGLIWYTLDVTVKATISLNPIPGASNCRDSYMINGSPINTGIIQATNSSGVVGWVRDATGKPAVGDWIGIKFTNYWLNNNTGGELQTAAMKWGTNGLWYDLTEETNNAVTCMYQGRNAQGIKETWVYLQVINPAVPYLRVADHDSNFLANTGSLNFTVYSVIYTPVPTGCGLDYAIGDYLGTRSAPANSSSGIVFAFNAVGEVPLDATGNPSDRIVVVETTGTWVNNSIIDIHGGIRRMDANPDPWEALEAYSLALCVETLDPLGHVRVYFEVSPDILQYGFRAQDAVNYADNTGQATFKFYQATYIQDDDDQIPGEDNCDGQYAVGSVVDSFPLPATANNGVYLDSLEEEQYYAIVTSGGPWTNNGVESFEIAMAASTGQPSGWTPIINFALCTDYNGPYTTSYFYTQPGYKFYVRVNDEGGNFSDNAGNMGITIYGATNDSDNWENCGDGYTLTEMATDPALTVIPGNLIGGTNLLYITTGANGNNDFALEILGTSAWSDPDVTADYEAEICLNDASGCSWTPISDAEIASLASCVVLVDADKRLYRMYFTAEGDYKLRVHDTDLSFMENSGHLNYKLYGTHFENGTDGDDGTPQPWEASCSTACLRPTSLFTRIDVSFGDLGTIHLPLPDVGGWVSWMSCTVVKYFTWCPYHTARLQGIGMSLAENTEPLATVTLLFDFAEEVKSQVEVINIDPEISSPFDPISSGGGGEEEGGSALNSLPDSTAPEAPANAVELLMPGVDSSTSPWFGGSIDLTATTAADAGKAATIAECTSRFVYYVGSGAGEMVCKLRYMVMHSDIFVALLIALDAAIIFFLVFRYLPGYIKRGFKLIEGDRAEDITRVISRNI